MKIKKQIFFLFVIIPFFINGSGLDKILIDFSDSKYVIDMEEENENENTDSEDESKELVTNQLFYSYNFGKASFVFSSFQYSCGRFNNVHYDLISPPPDHNL